MRLLVHGINYAPELVGIGKYTSEMAEWFAGRGHDVHVHTARPYYPLWREFPDYDPAADRERRNGVEVTRHSIHLPETTNALGRIRHHLSWLWQSRRALLRTAESFQPDIVLSVAPSLIGAPAALHAARRVGAKSMLHIQDFEVGASAATGLVSSKALISAATGIEKAIISRFDFTTTISAEMEAVLHRLGVSPDRTAIVRNWVDLERVQAKPQGESEIRHDLGIGPDSVVCLYAGTISRKQGLDTLIDAARELRSEPDIIFLIFGEGPTKADYELLAADLPNVRFGPFQPSEMFSDLLAAADIHLLPQIAGAADLVLPSKLPAMLASGRPVIATAASGTSLAREMEGCGVCVDPGDPTALAAAIRVLAKDQRRREEFGRHAQIRARADWEKNRTLLRLEAQIQAWLAGTHLAPMDECVAEPISEPERVDA